MTAPVLMLALAGLAAMAVIGLHVTPAALVSAGLATAVFAGNTDEVGLPIGPERLLLALGVVVLAWGLDRAQRSRNVRLRWEHGVMVVLVVLAAISSTLAGTLLDDGFRGLYALFDRLSITAFVLFTVAPLVFHDARTRKVLVAALVALGGYLGLTALAEGFGVEQLVFPSYIADPSVGIHSDRARGPMTESAGFGLALFECAVVALLATRMWRSILARRVAFAVAALCSFGVLFTLTRAVWVGAAAAAVVVAVLRPEWRRAIVGGTLACSLAVLISLGSSDAIRDRVYDRAGNEGPIWDRINLVDAGIRAVEEHPTFGVGWRQFTISGEQYVRQRPDIPQSGHDLDIHNVVLSLAAELGVVGALLWCVIVAATLGRAIVRRPPRELQDWHVALVAMAVQFGVVAMLTPFSYPFSFFLLWTWSGVLLADRLTEPTAPVREEIHALA